MTPGDNWEPPDRKRIASITEAVADELTSGRPRSEIVADLVGYDEWPQDIAESFVSQVDEERLQFHGPSVEALGDLPSRVLGRLSGGQAPEIVAVDLTREGWDESAAMRLVSGVDDRRIAADAELAGQATTDFVFSTLASLVGAILTAGTFSGAEGGGVHYIFWGLVLYGGLRFLQGVVHVVQAPNGVNLALGLLAFASLGLGVASMLYVL